MFREISMSLCLSVSLGSAAVGAELPLKEVRDLRFLGGGISDTFRGTIDGKPHSLKPIQRFGESTYGEFGQGNPEGDLIALALMRAVGLTAPGAFLFRPGPAPHPVLAVEWVDKSLTGSDAQLAERLLNEAKPSEFDLEQFALMFVMDALIGNPDRHGRNYFVYRGPGELWRPVPIDHNLALRPEDWKELEDCGPSVEEFEVRVAMAGGLARDPAWVDRVLEASRTIARKVDGANIERILASLPAVIPAERVDFLRRYLDIRLGKLQTLAKAWKETFLARPRLDLPARIRFWLLGRNTEQTGRTALKIAHLLEISGELAAPLARVLGVDPGDASVSVGLRMAAAACATALGIEVNSWNDEELVHARRFLAAIQAGAAFLRIAGNIDEAKARELLCNATIGLVFRRDLYPQQLHERLNASAKYFGISLDLRRHLQLVEIVFRHVAADDPRARLPRWRWLFRTLAEGEARKKEEAERRARAARHVSGRLGETLRRLVDGIGEEAIRDALVAVLGRHEGAVLEDGVPLDPAVLSLALKTACTSLGQRLDHDAFWQKIFENADFRKADGGPSGSGPGVWLAGWEGPVDLNDPRLSVSDLEAQGFQADAAARMLFERYRAGVFLDLRDPTASLYGWHVMQFRLILAIMPADRAAQSTHHQGPSGWYS